MTRLAMGTALMLLTVGCGSDAAKGDPEAPQTPDVDTDVPGDTGASSGDCPEDVALFEERVWQPVLSTHCYGCHAADGIASGTRMVLDEADMLGNLRAASAVSDLLLVKPTGLDAVGHGGGTLVEPESDAWEALSFWVDWTNGVCDATVDACTDEPSCLACNDVFYDEDADVLELSIDGRNVPNLTRLRVQSGIYDVGPLPPDNSLGAPAAATGVSLPDAFHDPQ